MTTSKVPERRQRRSITATGPVVVGGHYQLTREIGTGGTAEVWVAQHTLGRFPCAVKMMHMTRNAFKLCREEFRILSQVYHPNIVRTFDMGFIDDTDQAYLSMEYVSGKPWDKLQTQTVPAIDAVRWLRQMVSVLSYLHDPQIHIIHKDIKPANIVVEHERAVLIDFNISSATDPEWGTPAYKCPLVEERGEWMPYADVWALALSFYELVTGKDVFSEAPDFSVALDADPNVNIPAETFEGIKDVIGGAGEDARPEEYAELFGLGDTRHAGTAVPDAIVEEFRITSRNQRFLTLAMLAQDEPLKPTSKNVISRGALRAASLPAGRVAMEKLRQVYSQLKSRGVVEYSGKSGAKARLTERFLLRFAEEAEDTSACP